MMCSTAPYLRFLAFLLLCTCGSVPAIAQRLHAGLQASLTGSRTRSLEVISIPVLHPNPGLRPGDRVGVLMGSHIGMFAEYQFARRAAVVTEPGFLFQTYFRRVLDQGITTTRIVYLQLPVLYKQHLSGKVSVVAGIQPRIFLYTRRLDSPPALQPPPKPDLKVQWYATAGLHASISPRLEGGFRLARSIVPVISVAPAAVAGDGAIVDTRAEMTLAYQIYVQYVLW